MVLYGVSGGYKGEVWVDGEVLDLDQDSSLSGIFVKWWGTDLSTLGFH